MIVFFRFSKVEQHPMCLDNSILHGNHIWPDTTLPDTGFNRIEASLNIRVRK